jgi:hypothetical protein
VFVTLDLRHEVRMLGGFPGANRIGTFIRPHARTRYIQASRLRCVPSSGKRAQFVWKQPRAVDAFVEMIRRYSSRASAK